MTNTKRNNKKKNYRRRYQKKDVYKIVNRGLCPIPDVWDTVMEFNDIAKLPLETEAHVIIRTNSPYRPIQATDCTVTGSTQACYGWTEMATMYQRYAVKKSTIQIEFLQGSSTPSIVMLLETEDSAAIADREDAMGNPRAKVAIAQQYVKNAKLFTSSVPYKLLGLDFNDDTYKALITASPANQRYYQCLIHPADGAVNLSGFIRITVRYTVVFSDRVDQDQT